MLHRGASGSRRYFGGRSNTRGSSRIPVPRPPAQSQMRVDLLWQHTSGHTPRLGTSMQITRAHLYQTSRADTNGYETARNGTAIIGTDWYDPIGKHMHLDGRIRHETQRHETQRPNTHTHASTKQNETRSGSNRCITSPKRNNNNDASPRNCTEWARHETARIDAQRAARNEA